MVMAALKALMGFMCTIMTIDAVFTAVLPPMETAVSRLLPGYIFMAMAE